MKRAGKTLFLWFVDILGINALCRTLNRKKAVILFYHGICEDGFDLLQGYDERHISQSSFRKQLGYLKQQGYVFVNMNELVNALKNRAKVGQMVVLTFDDGFKNVVENAYPIMHEFGARGCVYLVSDLIGTDRLLWTDLVETVIRNHKQADFTFIFRCQSVNYPLGDKNLAERAMRDIKAKLRHLPDKERLEHLRQFGNYALDDVPGEFLMAAWEQIKMLDSGVLEIGSHTRSHPNCDKLTSEEEIENELYNSKIEIEKNIGRKVIHFCYPAGAYNERIIADVKKYGYESAVTVNYGFVNANSDLFRLNRVESAEEFLHFKACMSGSYGIKRKITRLLRRLRPSFLS